MGDWTHVAGIIRMDKTGRMVEDWKEVFPDAYIPDYSNTDDRFDFDKFERECQAADKEHPWVYPEYHIPIKGECEFEDDEISLRVYREPCPNSMLGYTLSFIADMRYFKNQRIVLDWFCGICKHIEDSKYGFIRQAVITIGTETSKEVTTGFITENCFTDEMKMLVSVYDTESGEVIRSSKIVIKEVNKEVNKEVESVWKDMKA